MEDVISLGPLGVEDDSKQVLVGKDEIFAYQTSDWEDPMNGVGDAGRDRKILDQHLGADMRAITEVYNMKYWNYYRRSYEQLISCL
ncbi:hypothetical protein CDL15_Pgr007180 [Punica granatum]|uniref:Uncharacterized protein n=1 Tax=Punica granatum TaxID=22663 RepID=A0A218X8X0_PUNGR|nr:hypothetical protein CDL15_Pgr007180 [Punica granatum]